MKEQIEELKAEIARDEYRYSSLVNREGEILHNISHLGFTAACQRVRLVCEMQGLAEKIRRNKIMLTWARS